MLTYVIIVTYNASPWIYKCLSSVYASDEIPGVIVIDNNSSDDTLSIIDQYFNQAIVIKSAVNLGFGKANNIGLTYALDHGAEFVFLLNQDAWIAPNTISALKKVSVENPHYYILSPIHFAGDGKRLDLNFSLYASPPRCKGLFSDYVANRDNLKDIYETNFVNAAFWLLPRKSLLQIGGFDPLFPHYGEDDDFVNRVAYHGFKTGISPLAIAYHDREQVPFDLSRLTRDKRLKRQKVQFLIALKNINRGFLRAMMTAYWALLKSILKNLIKLDLYSLYVDIRTLTYVFSNTSKISASRKVSKKMGRSFI